MGGTIIPLLWASWPTVTLQLAVLAILAVTVKSATLTVNTKAIRAFTDLIWGGVYGGG